MFVKDTDLVDVKVYYLKKGKGHRYLSYTEAEFKGSVLKDDEKKQYKVLSLKMQQLTWGLYNQLQEDAMVEDINGNAQFNVKKYKENRLCKLIKEWDAINEEGKPVSIAPGSISHLSPDVAETILRGYDELSFVDEAEEGK